ncbi:MAG: hypothetical protein IJ880_17495 [Bacilli bacterium]|nr:hypothetical protein [Bacilli bacterium]
MGPIDDYFSPTYEIIKRLREPQKLYISSAVPDSVFDIIMREAKERLEKELAKEEFLTVNQMREMFGMPVIKCDYDINYGLAFPNITYEPFKICKINETEKETKKMEAKKCDRCGKLYEMPGACENPNGANVRFKFEKVYRAEEKSGTKIAEEQSKDIYIKYGFTKDTFVDFCPDCRASLKKWFENPEKEGK